MTDTEARVKRVIAEHLCQPVEQVTGNTLLIDLDADSLDAIEIQQALEEEFDIELPDEEVAGAQTVQQLVDLVKAKLG